VAFLFDLDQRPAGDLQGQVGRGRASGVGGRAVEDAAVLPSHVEQDELRHDLREEEEGIKLPWISFSESNGVKSLTHKRVLEVQNLENPLLSPPPALTFLERLLHSSPERSPLKGVSL